MKKQLIFSLFIILFSSLFSWEQNNNIPSPLKVLYPFSVEITFDKPYNLIKAELPSAKNLLKSNEEQWRATVTDTLVLTMMALQTGEIEVPAIQIITYDELNSDTLYTEPFNILVTAITDSTTLTTDIKTIQGSKDPILIESQYAWIYTLLKYLIALLILGFLIWIIYKYFNKVKDWLTRNKLAEEDILQMPWEYALTELKQIKQKMLLVSGEEYHFSIEMSLLIRRFLEKYYNIPAAERTTYELQAEFSQMSIKNSDKIISVLKKLDEVKYTKGKIVTEFNSDEIYSWFQILIVNIKELEDKIVNEARVK